MGTGGLASGLKLNVEVDKRGEEREEKRAINL
jgi:hypothetical protein